VRETEAILLLGAGGYCKSCLDLLSVLSNYNVAGIVNKKDSTVTEVLGVKVVGTDSDLELLISQYKNVLIAVGQIKSPKLRIKLFENAKRLGAIFPVLVSPNSQISQTARIDEGTICFHQTIINASASVGRNCIINNKSLVEHDAEIGSHCHISTGSLINGGVVIEDGCFIGSGAILHQGVRVGKNSVIGAGKILKTDIPPNTIVR